MKVTYNWLKQYMDLEGLTIQQIADALTKGGLEVEGVEKVASATKLIIGEVIECEDHPDSDHLHVCKVDTGDEVKQIVCGAPNVAKGQKVIVALPGCILPGGEIKNGTIRGVQSDGMICALFELGVDKKRLSEQQLNGIEVLPQDAPVGETNVLGYLGLDDTIFDVGLTPNRSDCLSMWSLAKEVGAILNKEVKLPDFTYKTDVKTTDLVINSETDKCPLFEGKIVGKVTIKPSPKWMSDALQAVGIKSINNVVDISNYVMLETGQPLHFYDLAKIPLKEITVKTGLNEKYVALDEVEYNIEENDIMITTGGKAIGIAGIMGGDDSKIDEETKGIIIEAATFNNVSIRNTSRRLGLDTEASTHFIKGLDPLGGHKAVERSVQLLIEYADASDIEETVVCGSDNYQQTKITSSTKEINKLLGTTFTTDEIFDVYRRLDYSPVKNSEDEIEVSIPSNRRDVKVWQDLSEEIIRILGYDNITSTLPLMPTIQGGLSVQTQNKRTIQNMLNGFGISEVITYSLVSKNKIDEGVLSVGQEVEIANAISDERKYYRTSLLPSMLDVISYNLARHNEDYGYFEIANVYDIKDTEQQHLSIALSSNKKISMWQKKENKNDFYTLKGIVVSVLTKLGFEEKRINFVADSNSNAILHPNKSALVFIDKTLVGIIGEVHPSCANKYDLDECVLGELNLTAVYSNKTSRTKFTPINIYPEVSYDLALVVQESVLGSDIIKTVKKAAGTLLKDVTIFDVYKGEHIAKGFKSVAIKLIYQSKEKTLTESEISPVHQEVISQLKSKLNASLREG